LGARSDQITTRILEVLEEIFPLEFSEKEKNSGRGPTGPPSLREGLDYEEEIPDSALKTSASNKDMEAEDNTDSESNDSALSPFSPPRDSTTREDCATCGG
jgi:hypothetical protein